MFTHFDMVWYLVRGKSVTIAIQLINESIIRWELHKHQFLVVCISILEAVATFEEVKGTFNNDNS